MNYDGPWSWTATKQVKRVPTQAEKEYALRVTKNKQKVATKASHARKRAERAEIKARNDAPIDFKCREERYWEALRRREREERGRKGLPERGSKGRERRATALAKATPDWADPKAMLRIYSEARIKSSRGMQVFHVDHIVPIQSKWVCGLNWEGNMQVLSGFDNMSKGNKSWPDMPDNLEKFAKKVISE